MIYKWQICHFRFNFLGSMSVLEAYWGDRAITLMLRPWFCLSGFGFATGSGGDSHSEANILPYYIEDMPEKSYNFELRRSALCNFNGVLLFQISLIRLKHFEVATTPEPTKSVHSNSQLYHPNGNMQGRSRYFRTAAFYRLNPALMSQYLVFILAIFTA